jgi:hypothetical protein
MSGNSRTGWWFSLPVPEGLEGTVWHNSPFGRKMVPEFIEGLEDRENRVVVPEYIEGWSSI